MCLYRSPCSFADRKKELTSVQLLPLSWNQPSSPQPEVNSLLIFLRTLYHCSDSSRAPLDDMIKSYLRMKMKVTWSCPTLCDPMDHTVHGILQARILEWVAFPFPRGSYQPRDQTQVSRIAGGFFTSWASREAQDTGVGSLCLLQWIFPTQLSNQGLLHCRRILYQLSY